jgi:hypothetical protein
VYNRRGKAKTLDSEGKTPTLHLEFGAGFSDVGLTPITMLPNADACSSPTRSYQSAVGIPAPCGAIRISRPHAESPIAPPSSHVVKHPIHLPSAIRRQGTMPGDCFAI